MYNINDIYSLSKINIHHVKSETILLLFFFLTSQKFSCTLQVLPFIFHFWELVNGYYLLIFKNRKGNQTKKGESPRRGLRRSLIIKGKKYNMALPAKIITKEKFIEAIENNGDGLFGYEIAVTLNISPSFFYDLRRKYKKKIMEIAREMT